MLIDTHAHLTYPGLIERIDEVLGNAAAAGVGRIISIASDVADAERVLDLAKSYGAVHATAGIHPHEAGKAGPDDVDRLAQLWRQPEVVAVGEIGLDYHYDFSDRPTQQRVFEAQLAAAAGTGLPLIVHCREAFDDCIALLEKHSYVNRPVVIHCFTGTPDEARAVAERGWRISFTGIVTFKKSTILQSIARTYLADKLMVETDAPYLAPVPVRHVRPNEPAYVAHTAAFLADLRGEALEALAARTTANARAFFNLPDEP